VTPLGDLLEALHRSHGAFATAHVEYRTWQHDARSAAAFTAAAEGGGWTAYAVLEGDEAPPEETRGAVRLWVERPSRLRSEHEGRHPRTVVVDGSRWWTWDEHDGATTGDRDASEGFGAEGTRRLLDPSPLIGLLDLEPLGVAERAGRRVLRARARAREVERDSGLDWELHALGMGADEWLLEVDVERGALLRVEARHRGEPFRVDEAVVAEFDVPIARDVFTFVAPEGREARRAEDRERSEQVALHEAAARAAFSVFVPERVPRDWDLDVRLSELHVVLWYRSREGAASVTVAQSRVADADFGGHGTNGPEWEEVERGGIVMRVRDRGARWPQAQIELERAGTGVLMHSESLDAAALVELAASLVEAPREPPSLP
jgi:hypothetical protein